MTCEKRCPHCGVRIINHYMTYCPVCTEDLSNYPELQKSNAPICPLLTLATVLSPDNVPGEAMHCKKQGCAMWNQYRKCCGLTYPYIPYKK